MKSDSRWLPVSMVVTFLAIGIPYWRIPYGGVNLPDALIGPGLLVVAISALLVRAAGAARTWKTTWSLGLAVVAVVAARVFVETARDPTSHNLWPFEVVIAAVLGFGCAFGAAVVGGLVAGVLPNRYPESDA